MFTNLQLTNFRKHEALVVDFTQGLNAVRAANEAGKSTVISAIAYALFGARALNESLADVVTYGKKETDLKVVLDFGINGIDYNLKRGKSGAELTFGTERITGQTEVTKYVESLLGCTADVATKLMLAKQSSVAGALAEGAAGAAKLIEVLANFELINELVDLVQTKLPSGNTSGLEAQIVQLSEQAAEVLTNDIPMKELAVLKANADYQAALANRAAVVVPDVSAITGRINQAGEARRHAVRLTQDIAAQQAVADQPLPADGDAALIAKLEQESKEATESMQAVRVWNELNAVQVINSVEKTAKDFAAALRLNEANVQGLSAEAQQLRNERVQLVAKLIKEKSCALCGKDLQDVPEVVTINYNLDEKIGGIDSQLEDYADALRDATLELNLLRAVQQSDQQLAIIFAKAGKWVQLDHSWTPVKYQWVGPTSIQAAPTAALNAEKLKQITHATAKGKQAQALSSVAALKAQLAQLPVITDEFLAGLQAEYGAAAALQTEANRLQDDLQLAYTQVTAANAALTQERAVFAEAQKRLDRAKVQLAIAVATLTEQNFNNNLIKKLRLARPRVADKLWSIVLASTSSYFSAIRGEVSAVTRTEDGFRVNGYSVAGLSGSTLDALGLAIRLSLTKTFLPNARFLILDETAAGMDEERETAMLGLIASCGMDQVILVTHSQLADAFAHNIITL